jgi:hypothetical protein
LVGVGAFVLSSTRDPGLLDRAMAEETQTAQASWPEPLSVVWRVLALPQTSLVLAGLLAVVLVIASLIPQIPAQAMTDPQAWLATQPGPLGRRDSLIATLELYNLAHGPWIHLLLALGALVLFVRLVESAELAWCSQYGGLERAIAFLGKESRAPRVDCLSSLPPEEVQEQVGRFLHRRGYRVAESAGSSPAKWLASRRPALLWIEPLGYAALLLAGAGLVLSSYWGWQDEVWQPLPGETQLVGHGRPYALRLDGFEMQFDQQGRLGDYASRVTWLEGADVVHETAVSTRQPTRFEGLSLHQVGYLPRIQLQAWDGGGNPLALESGGEARPGTTQVEIRFLKEDEQPLVLVPAQGQLLVFVFEPVCRLGQPALHVDTIDEDGNGRQRLASLTSSGEVVTHDLRLRIELSYGPMLRLNYQPGTGLVLWGLGLAALALLVGWIAPPRVLSLVAEPRREGGVRMQIVAPPGARIRQWLGHLAVRLEGALGDDR